jgi:hypothetical protein
MDCYLRVVVGSLCSHGRLNSEKGGGVGCQGSACWALRALSELLAAPPVALVRAPQLQQPLGWKDAMVFALDCSQDGTDPPPRLVYRLTLPSGAGSLILQNYQKVTYSPLDLGFGSLRPRGSQDIIQLRAADLQRVIHACSGTTDSARC